MDVLTFLGRGELLVLHPAPAVAAYIETCRADGLGGGLVTLDGKCAAKHGQWEFALLEQPHQTPESDPATVFEHAFAGEVAALDALLPAMRLGEANFGEALAILHGGFRALLVVHDEVDGEAGAARPLGIGWVGSVADQVPVVGLVQALISISGHQAWSAV